MGYFIWIPLLIILTIVWALMAKQVNLNPQSYFFYILFIAVPVWPFVARSSKNLLFDGMVYDALMTIVYTMTFVFLGTGSNFTMLQWIGCFVSLIGLLMMKAPV